MPLKIKILFGFLIIVIILVTIWFSLNACQKCRITHFWGIGYCDRICLPLPNQIGGSITEIENLCILESGKSFRSECENKEVVLDGLYLYPLQDDETLLDGFHLYSSDSFKHTKLTSIDSNLLLTAGNYITAYTKNNIDLFRLIEKKAETISEPVNIDVKGTIEITENCAGQCRYDIVLELKTISFP